MSAAGLRTGLIWTAFAGASVLATAPLWRLWVFGFNPTLDELLRIICTGS